MNNYISSPQAEQQQDHQNQQQQGFNKSTWHGSRELDGNCDCRMLFPSLQVINLDLQNCLSLGRRKDLLDSRLHLYFLVLSEKISRDLTRLCNLRWSMEYECRV
ncbi:hypothetical protein ACET3Z_024217 [Daucus carota]